MSSTPLRPLSHLLAVLLICAVGCGEQIQATSSSDGDVISDAGNGAGADTGTVDTSSDDTAFVDTSSDDTNSNGCETQAVANPLNTKMATVEKSEFIYSTPPNSTGLVLIFHGGGGSKEDNLVLRGAR